MKFGKKAQASGFISGIFDSIGHFMSTMPPFLRYLLFLVFIFLFIIILNFFFGAFGYHCDSSENLYKTSIFSVYTNLGLIVDKPIGEDLTSSVMESKQVDTFNVGASCVITDGNGTKHFNDGGVCTDCERAAIYPRGDTLQPKIEVCVGDVNRTRDSEKSIWKRSVCSDDRPFLYCDVPVNYFFDQSEGGYSCANLDICGNITVGRQWDSVLQEKAERVYQSPDTGKAYNEVFAVSCTELNPTIKMFGIPIFDYRIWIFLMVLWSLLIMYFKLKDME